MTNHEVKTEQFTGLILLSAEDRPGIAAELFQTLAPFSVSIIDIGQIVIRKRLILTVLIALNSDHQIAIESDLAICATENDVDIATTFSKSSIPSNFSHTTTVTIASQKLHPASLSLICASIQELGANIESIQRELGQENCYSMRISGIDGAKLHDAINLLQFDAHTSVKIGN